MTDAEIRKSLQRALRSSDPELRARAQRILTDIEDEAAWLRRAEASPDFELRKFAQSKLCYGGSDNA